MSTAYAVTKVPEQSTIQFTVAFSAVPSAVTWTLTDMAGSVINSRLAVAATPGTSVVILLAGADNAMVGEGDSESHKLLVEATYGGNPYKAELMFEVTRLVGLANG